MSAIAIGYGTPFQKTELPPTSTSSRGATIAKHAGLGALAGLAAGIGVSLLTKIIPMPIAAAIGGAAGLLIGGLIGLLRTRNQSTTEGVVGQHQFIQAAPPVPAGVGTSGLPPQGSF